MLTIQQSKVQSASCWERQPGHITIHICIRACDTAKTRAPHLLHCSRGEESPEVSLGKRFGLPDRSQVVIFRNHCSGKLKISSRLPQGSILSPILFAIFLDDLLTTKFINHIIAYADDIKLIGPPSPELQNYLTKIDMWSSANHIKININKSKTILYNSSNKHVKYTICNTQ